MARLAEMGLTPMAAAELEFFLFEKSYDEIRKSGFRDLAPISGYLAVMVREEEYFRPAMT